LGAWTRWCLETAEKQPFYLQMGQKKVLFHQGVVLGHAGAWTGGVVVCTPHPNGQQDNLQLLPRHAIEQNNVVGGLEEGDRDRERQNK
jgi:hypothetical protein